VVEGSLLPHAAHDPVGLKDGQVMVEDPATDLVEDDDDHQARARVRIGTARTGHQEQREGPESAHQRIFRNR